MTRPPFRPVKPRALGTVKAMVSDLYEQAGGVDQVMVRLGIGKSDAYAWTDPNRPKKQITFARVAALTSASCTAAVEYLAALAGGLFLPMPSDKTPIGSLTAESIKRSGAAAAELVKALADGQLSRNEAAQALPDLDAALRALALLRSTVADVARPPPDKSST